jgi:hypothetical protein
MAHRPLAALGIALATATLVVTGCGSSGTQTASSAGTTTAVKSSGSTATKAQFIAQAEVICRKLAAEEQPLKARQEALRGLPATATEKPFVSLADQVVTLSHRAEGELRALSQPPAEAGKIKQLLTVYSEEATDVSNIAYAGAHQVNSTGEAAAQALKRSIAVNRAAARELGMKDCIESE